jgi:hypothetical protein
MAFHGGMEGGSLLLFSGKKNFHFVEEVNTKKPYHKSPKMGLYVVYSSQLHAFWAFWGRIRWVHVR